MAVVKESHVAPQMAQYDKRYVLPVVVIRHPLAWLQSMCAHSYAASWKHDKLHCPNFVPNDKIDIPKFGKATTSFPVTVKFDEKDHVTFDSLIHLWNEWYRQYLDVNYPILVGTCFFCFCFHKWPWTNDFEVSPFSVFFFFFVWLLPNMCMNSPLRRVRAQKTPQQTHFCSPKKLTRTFRLCVEPTSHQRHFAPCPSSVSPFFSLSFQQQYYSLVFQPHLVLHEIAQCVGGTVRSPLLYQTKTSKSHGSGTDLIAGIRKTADLEPRGILPDDKDYEYYRRYVDADLIRMFHYNDVRQ
jgi:hypothetical protein